MVNFAHCLMEKRVALWISDLASTAASKQALMMLGTHCKEHLRQFPNVECGIENEERHCLTRTFLAERPRSLDN
jgi:hypothetical protein